MAAQRRSERVNSYRESAGRAVGAGRLAAEALELPGVAGLAGGGADCGGVGARCADEAAGLAEEGVPLARVAVGAGGAP